jgi:hypothetical protein
MHPTARTALLASAALAALTAPVSPALAADRGPAAHGAEDARHLTWKVVPSPNEGPPASASNLLSAVSCVSARACTAVGSFFPGRATPARSLIESWNGTAWTIAPSPKKRDTGLQSVSCLSASACTAVGLQGLPGRTLAESWNGTAWTIVPSPNAGPASASNGLSGVSCVSGRFCAAVGNINVSQNIVKTLIESWNGTRWAVVPSPNRPHARLLDGLNSVSCVSARSCTAVGSAGVKTLIETWNGTAWSIVPSPNGPAAGGESILDGISCVSASACTAVGYAGAKSLVESWNGTAWSIVPSPNEGPTDAFDRLDGVSCTSARSCAAVGSFSYLVRHRDTYRTLAESWNGTSWAVVPSPSGAHGIAANFLLGVSCASAVMCSAVGNYGDGLHGRRKTLAELGAPAPGQPG